MFKDICKWDLLPLKFSVGTGIVQETTLHVVAAILRTLRDPRTLPVCSSVTISIPYELG